MAKWQKTKHPGVRFYEHEIRKHGIQKDKYFAIRYQRDGKRREEGLGWSSEGWNAEKVAIELAELKKANTLGTGPSTLKEKRTLAKKKKESERLQKENEEKENISFGNYFQNTYFPVAKDSKKPGSFLKEEQHFRLWIKPVLGNRPFKTIKPIHIEKIKKNISSEGRSPRTVQYVFATIRQVWNRARADGLVFDDSPTKKVKIPRIDNKRIRFLSQDEAEALLENLSIRNMQTHDMSLLSLDTGMRAAEIFALTWGNVDTERGIISVFDAKGGSRFSYMTERVKKMFLRRGPKGRERLVFTDKKGGILKEMPQTFRTAVKALRFNEHIPDRRERVVFHTLRHTFASWLVEAGEDIYVVKKLMGHASISMTERYSHLSPGTLRNAIQKLEKQNERKKTGKVFMLKK